mmetsp:Transcript_7426/g.22560  ORF Transcript_7426/g.22560 Transcript_7426/m.22560 type:complete len:212 (-) Transcript_7426:1505-2140(-)
MPRGHAEREERPDGGAGGGCAGNGQAGGRVPGRGVQDNRDEHGQWPRHQDARQTANERAPAPRRARGGAADGAYAASRRHGVRARGAAPLRRLCRPQQAAGQPGRNQRAHLTQGARLGRRRVPAARQEWLGRHAAGRCDGAALRASQPPAGALARGGTPPPARGHVPGGALFARGRLCRLRHRHSGAGLVALQGFGHEGRAQAVSPAGLEL